MNKILITSIGRTGTVSLAHYLNQIQGVNCYHEKERQDVGFLFLSQTDRYSTLANSYLEQRTNTANAEQADYYIEVNPYLRFANPEVLQDLGWNKIMLSRAPKSYLESVFTRRLFQKNDFILDQLPDNQDSYATTWYSLTRFQKLCWYYSKVGEFMLNSTTPVFKFEEVIKTQSGLKELLKSIGLADKVNSFELPKLNSSASGSLKSKIKDLLVGKPFPDTPLDWNSLTESELETYNTLCLPIAKKLGYELL